MGTIDRGDLQEEVRRLFADLPPVAKMGGAKAPRDLVMFDEPLVGVGSVRDPLFARLRDPDVVGPWHLLPTEWMHNARSVVSLFFPISAAARESNRGDADVPSLEWLYCRIEGQAYLQRYASELARRLSDLGVRAIVPCLDERFKAFKGAMVEGESEPRFASTWSERHIAYICGLGTFGLSKGLITKRGMAGRFISLVVDCEIAPDERPYTDVYEYCIECGECARRCPVGAIDPVAGKAHGPCYEWVAHTGELYAPRYGCGKCQTDVPCEFRIP